MPFVPDDFSVPTSYEGDGFRFEPLAPRHNERDHAAWMGSIDHIVSTPGFAGWGWPEPMSLDQNLRDLESHAADFAARTGFTYSILDGDEVIGCLYIYPLPDRDDVDASVRSWVTADRAHLDAVVWRTVRRWLERDWPFTAFEYADRPTG